MHHRTLRIVHLLLLASGAALLTGCASASKPTAMVPPLTAGALHASSHSVSVNVTGGKKTNPAWTSQISDEDFTTAIKSTIEQSKVFQQVLGSEAADLHLDVMLVRMEQPMFGFSMTVTLEASWTLRRRSDNSVVWQKAVVSKYTAEMGEAFVGTTRLRLANEGAARENIKDALTAIAELKLP